jgi:hypothetical protein
MGAVQHAQLNRKQVLTRPASPKGVEMISVVHNEVLKAIEIYLDTEGADLLIQTLEKLKSKGGHLHLYATNDNRGVSTKSPYQQRAVYRQLVLDLLPSEAWEDMRSE